MASSSTDRTDRVVGASTPDDAPRRPVVGEKTTGASTPGTLHLAQWNVGLNTEKAFRKDNVIATHMETLVKEVITMLKHMDMVAINELHCAHFAHFDHLLHTQAPELRLVGFPQGDAACWRRPSSRASSRATKL